MKILVTINTNTATPKHIKSFKVFDLGEVVTTIDDLLDVSSIQITDDILPILKITDVDGEKQYLVNGLGEPSNGIIPYYTDDFEKDITIDDLVLVGGSGGSSDSRPYKVYTALLTQSGTDAPVATVLENTLGGDVVWSYNSIGIYHATSIGSFTENKTILPNTYTASVDGAISSTFDFFNLDENIVSIRTSDIMGTNQDDLINFNGEDFLFEIRVYN